MKTKFTKGLIKGLLYYSLGFVAAWLTYIIFGWDYKHTPGLHHIVAFLFLLGGAGCTLYYFVLTLTGVKSKVNFGVFAGHLLAILTFALYVIIDIKTDEVTEYKSSPKDIISINRDIASKTSSIVDATGETLYLLKSDTVLINNIKSDTTNHH